MPEYDESAETYQRRSGMETPYSIVDAFTFFQVLGSVRGLSVLDLAAGDWLARLDRRLSALDRVLTEV